MKKIYNLTSLKVYAQLYICLFQQIFLRACYASDTFLGAVDMTHLRNLDMVRKLLELPFAKDEIKNMTPQKLVIKNISPTSH